MGWLFPYGATRRDLIEDRTKSWETTSGEMLVKSTCLAHCFRGGVFSGVLWTVRERTFTANGDEVQPAERWIGCDLLRCVQGEWGYKDLDENCGPCFYSCPQRYLDMVPLDRFGWAPAISFNGDDPDAIQNAYVTPLPEVDKESCDQRDWERVRGAVLAVYG